MKKEEAISYLQQLYPNGGHCWLDEQRIEAISIAVKALQEEPVKIKKGCKYRCLSDMVNRDTGNISFIGDKIYLAPKDNTLVSEENGWLCDTSENASNFELVEEPKKCMYSKDDYTDEDRKVLCDGCEEECRFNKKEDSVNNGFDSGCGVIWKEEPVSEDLIEELKKIVNIRECVSQGVPVIKIAKHFAQWQKDKFTALLNAEKDKTSIGLNELENGIEHGRMEVINSLTKKLEEL